jgi:hypothetical protein
MLRFRESVRHNWNTYFQDAQDLMGPEIQEAFTLVEQGLFQGIVLYACNVDIACEYRKAPISFIRVVPRPEMHDLTFQTGTIVLRTTTDKGYWAWDPPVRFKVEESTRLEFIRFFDWYSYGQINMSLVQVYIARMDTRPDWVGGAGAACRT